MEFTDREIILLRMAVSYALSNSDDMNDALAHTPVDDPHNENGMVKVGLDVVDSPTDEEISKFLERLSPEAIEAEILKGTKGDAEAALHKEQQRHQETKWKYSDSVNRERRWRDACMAFIRAAFPEPINLQEDEGG